MRVDAVASMLYLDYSREEGEWIPNQFGGRENLEAIGFLKSDEHGLHRDPGIVYDRRGVHAGRRLAATYLGGLGFGLKWNMGWMHDTLSYIADPIHRSYHHARARPSAVYAFSENFILPSVTTRSSTARDRCYARCPATAGRSSPTCARLYAYMWAHPGKKAPVHGPASSPRSRSGAEERGLDWWTCSTSPEHAAHSRRWCAT